MTRWYEIHQSELIRARLREAERERLVAEARRLHRRESGQGPSPRLPGRTALAAALGVALGWFAGR